MLYGKYKLTWSEVVPDKYLDSLCMLYGEYKLTWSVVVPDKYVEWNINS
jgi:hypothetical protein